MKKAILAKLADDSAQEASLSSRQEEPSATPTSGAGIEEGIEEEKKSEAEEDYYQALNEAIARNKEKAAKELLYRTRYGTEVERRQPSPVFDFGSNLGPSTSTGVETDSKPKDSGEPRVYSFPEGYSDDYDFDYEALFAGTKKLKLPVLIGPQRFPASRGYHRDNTDDEEEDYGLFSGQDGGGWQDGNAYSEDDDPPRGSRHGAGGTPKYHTF